MFRAISYDIMQMRDRQPIRVLSFPGPMWGWEQGLLGAFPAAKFKIVGLERDSRIHEKLVKAAVGLPGKLRMTDAACSFSQFAEQHTKRNVGYDIIYLDWMGTWSREKKADLETLFARNLLRPDGVLILTVSLRRGNPETLEELNDLAYDLPVSFYDARGRDRYVNNIKVRGIPHWVEAAAADRGVAMRPLMASIYYSNTGISDQAQPQLQILMKRETKN